MPYEFYKVLHIFCVFIFLTGSSYLLLSKKRDRAWQIITGVASLFILVAGMGLVARLGSGMATWVISKIVIWLILTSIGHIAAKRFPERGPLVYWFIMVLALVAVVLAVYKPFA